MSISAAERVAPFFTMELTVLRHLSADMVLLTTVSRPWHSVQVFSMSVFALPSGRTMSCAGRRAGSARTEAKRRARIRSG